MEISKNNVCNFRIGYGFDSHPFAYEEERSLIIAGVTIPAALGLEGHSNNDVALHALMDALLGAAALGDIGQHFSAQDATLKNIDSRILLREIVGQLQTIGYQIVNIDLTVITSFPQLSPWRNEMRRCVSEDLMIPIERVNIKFTGQYRLTSATSAQGIESAAIVLLYLSDAQC